MALNSLSMLNLPLDTNQPTLPVWCAVQLWMRVCHVQWFCIHCFIQRMNEESYYCCVSARLCSVHVRRMMLMLSPRHCVTTTRCRDLTLGTPTCYCVSRRALKESRTCYEADTGIFCLLHVLHRWVHRFSLVHWYLHLHF